MDFKKYQRKKRKEARDKIIKELLPAGLALIFVYLWVGFWKYKGF